MHLLSFYNMKKNKKCYNDYGDNMKNIEIEYKVMVDKQSFIKLESYLDNHYLNKKHIQTNYYYDTRDNKIKNKGLSLRIRHIENENIYISTLKEKQNEARIEYEDVIKCNDIYLINNEAKSILEKNNININQIEQVAYLKTIRKEYMYHDCLLCLDYNLYYNKEDYEIECEAESMEKAKELVLQLLNKFNVSYQESKDSKVARALKNRID